MLFSVKAKPNLILFTPLQPFKLFVSFAQSCPARQDFTTTTTMPPKKAANKAKATPSKASAPAAEAPSTVTNSKGKEIETTAAAGRTRRAAALESPTKKAPAKKAAAKTATTTCMLRARSLLPSY